MVEWVALDATRVVFEHPSGFLVIKPGGPDDPVPVFCGTCGLPNLTSDDVIAYKEEGCCSHCVMHWVEPRRSEWVVGWRPSVDEVEYEVSRRSIGGYRALV